MSAAQDFTSHPINGVNKNTCKQSIKTLKADVSFILAVIWNVIQNPSLFEVLLSLFPSKVKLCSLL